jgi:hypothetical protein
MSPRSGRGQGGGLGERGRRPSWRRCSRTATVCWLPRSSVGRRWLTPRGGRRGGGPEGQAFRRRGRWCSQAELVLRDLLGEPLMRSVGVEVARVVGENPFEVTLAEDEEMIEALASHAAQEALADRVGSWSPDGDRSRQGLPSRPARRGRRRAQASPASRQPRPALDLRNGFSDFVGSEDPARVRVGHPAAGGQVDAASAADLVRRATRTLADVVHVEDADPGLGARGTDGGAGPVPARALSS